MKFEIINPSDKAYIEGEFLPCAVAVMLFGKGTYALKGDCDEHFMPVFFQDLGFMEKWFEEHNIPDIQNWVAANHADVAAAADTVRLDGERTSTTDIVGNAQYIAEMLRKNYPAK